MSANYRHFREVYCELTGSIPKNFWDCKKPVIYYGAKQRKNMNNENNKVNGRLVTMTATDVIEGVRKGRVSVIASRPAGGKTTLACLIAANAIRDTSDAAIVYFSLEMPSSQLSERIRSLTDANTVQSKNLVIDDTTAIDVDEICQRVKSLKAKKSIQLVIVDYLQLVNCEKRHSEGRQAEIAEIGEMLRDLAKNEDIAVVVLAQMSHNCTAETSLGECGLPKIAAERFTIIENPRDEQANANQWKIEKTVW